MMLEFFCLHWHLEMRFIVFLFIFPVFYIPLENKKCFVSFPYEAVSWRKISFLQETGDSQETVFFPCYNLSSLSLLQEIPLSEILQVELPGDYSNLAQGSNPHCFEIITATMVYYVGENNTSPYHSPALAASGVGMEVAQGWEKAIRQALMPVTPQPSVASAVGQGKDHSE